MQPGSPDHRLEMSSRSARAALYRLHRNRADGFGAQATGISFGELVVNLLHSGVRGLFGHGAAMPLPFLEIDLIVLMGAHIHASVRSTSGSPPGLSVAAMPVDESAAMWINIYPFAQDTESPGSIRANFLAEFEKTFVVRGHAPLGPDYRVCDEDS